MGETVDEALARRVIEAAPWAAARAPEGERFTAALDWLVRQQEHRRGAPDPLTEALLPLALTEGPVLKAEFDLSVHAHTGWEAGALGADVREMMRLNERLGFPGGDRVLADLAAGLRAAFPAERLLRLHGDCLVVLFLPSCGEPLRDEHLARARTALAGVASAVQGWARGLDQPLQLTLAALRLRILDPSHWQVLGPLLVAELERAQVLARRGLASGIQERELRLDGRVPTPRG